MTDTANVQAMRENPELFRVLLKAKVEEIAAGISYHWKAEINKSAPEISAMVFEKLLLTPVGPHQEIGVEELVVRSRLVLNNDKPVDPSQPCVFQNKKLLQEKFKNAVFPVIDEMWTSVDLISKLKTLNELEQKYPKDHVACRPSTENIPIRKLKGNHLMALKDGLLYKSKKYQTQLGVLQEALITKATTLKQSRKNIDEAEELYSKICGDYEELTRVNLD